MIEVAAIAAAMSQVAGGLKLKGTERYSPGWIDPRKPGAWIAADHAVYRDLWPKTFPRTEAMKDHRMDMRMGRIRKQIDIRNRRRAKIVALAVVLPPVTIIVFSALWRVAIYLMVS